MNDAEEALFKSYENQDIDFMHQCLRIYLKLRTQEVMQELGISSMFEDDVEMYVNVEMNDALFHAIDLSIHESIQLFAVKKPERGRR